ncbi:hypothetical protein [Glutamicibacter sp.]|uniref:hypothetical protein n=1 Tax=Glutamicibacter sp. TaxID=1931995 RepID=UPI0028BDDCAC|nr:hypothetical protein [Glutamicibacter sp.]
MSLDDSQLRLLSEDLGLVPNGIVPKVRGVVRKGAVNVKNAMQADIRESASFRIMARSVDFDEMTSGAFGATSYAAEIGPNKSRHSSAGLAGFAYFGGSPGGGGTVRDPAEALADEAPAFEEYLLELLEGLL